MPYMPVEQLRKRRSNANYLVVAAGTTAEVCGPSPQRVGLIISTDGSAAAYAGPIPKANSPTGINLSNIVPAVYLTIEEHGDVVQRPWVLTATATMNVMVIEVLQD